ncbi:2'-5' RNA ligase family protein [Dactylosporangium sp. NPDC006015]|uniref:2'-5' RNA ligase family protein n=1 Tax=Dactylosporangium sp. NPDC006015 TaxID=3154576 RepID=UPI0033AA3B3A
MSRQQEDWDRFSSLTTMQNHWDRPAWTPGRQAYYWYLTWDSAPLRSLAEQCQSRLQLPYLDPVPLDALHLTMAKLAWEDQITPAEVKETVGRATDLCTSLRPFTLTAGPLAGSPGAVRLTVTPWEPVLELNRQLVAAGSASCLNDEAAFRPHIGVAYCNSNESAKSLIARVEPLRGLPTVSVTTMSAELVLLRREGSTYRWSTCASVPLGME